VHEHRREAQAPLARAGAGKEAYAPEDITAPPTDPVAVWRQFFGEAKIQHDGVMHPPPPIQMELL
jgi:hypothetical protein